jgi:hypothetical protein
LKEVWLPVVGFGKLYHVSNLGRIRSLRTGRFMSLSLDAYGYPQVGFYPLNGKMKTAKVHRVVARAFLGRAPRGKPEVDHKNHRRADNRLVNLRWSSVTGNRFVVRSRGASGVVGVRLRADRPNPWQAYHGTGCNFKSLGHFKTKKAAVAARKEFELERNQREHASRI